MRVTAEISPKDRFITVYGRNPVHEVLLDDDLVVDKVVLADNAHGAGVREIQQAARRRGIEVQRTSAERVKKLAGNGRQDQGVFADVVAPRMLPLEVALAQGTSSASWNVSSSPRARCALSSSSTASRHPPTSG